MINSRAWLTCQCDGWEGAEHGQNLVKWVRSQSSHLSCYELPGEQRSRWVKGRGKRGIVALFFPQQRKLMGFSAQISAGVCRCGSQEQVPERGSGRFRRVPVRAGVGSGGRVRKVPESESSGAATLTGAAMWLFWTLDCDHVVHMGKATAQKKMVRVVKHGIRIHTHTHKNVYIYIYIWYMIITAVGDTTKAYVLNK